MNKYSKAKNLFYLPSPNITSLNDIQRQQANFLSKNHGGSLDYSRNLNLSLAPVNKPRMVLDVVQWRESLRMAEDALLPQRYLMQLCYMDTVLDAHVKACLNTRENLTLRRKFVVCDDNENINSEWTKFFMKPWFKTWTKYTLGARWYGYSLISMGDIRNDEICNIVLIPRTHISPDRLNVVPVPDSVAGELFLQEPWIDTHIWIACPDEHGLTSCSYGLLYELTLLSIGLRNNLQFNQQFLEIFGMPFRYVKTDNYDTKNQDRLENMLAEMGSLGYGVIRKDEELEFIDSGKGQGYKGYGDLEMRIERKISKIVLGHSDALDSAGKSPQNNSSTGMAQSPQAQALDDMQSSDGEFMMDQINNTLFPFLIRNGFNIPSGLHFEYTNDFEDKELEKHKNEENVKITSALLNLSKGGYTVDPAFIAEITGFKVNKDIILPFGGSLDTEDDYNASKPVKPVASPKQDSDNKKKSNIVNYKFKDPIREAKRKKKELDREYRSKTQGFDGDRKGLTKEEYYTYKEDFIQKIEDRTIEDGPINFHINCDCECIAGRWEIGPSCCDECADAADDYNDD